MSRYRLSQTQALGKIVMPYDQRSETPRIQEYRNLRTRCGLSQKSAEAATIGLSNSLFSTTIRDEGKLIAMGRIVGDGGSNFTVVDIAVHPDYQRQGLGGFVMKAIMSYIHAYAPNTAYIDLIADHHSPALYSKYGFEPVAPNSIGMAYKVTK